jgi:hypothetical protein
MRLFNKSRLLLLLMPFAFCRCADLKEVGSFAATSQQIMEKNKTVSYGYYDYYHDSAYIYNSMPADLRDADCHFDAEKQADTSITNECALLSAYFGKLALFTDPKAAIDVNPLGKSVTAGRYGMITISNEESNIASGLATGLSDLFTTTYKSKKLKDFIRNYHDSVAPLIGFLAIRARNIAIRMRSLELEVKHVADSLISHTNQNELKWPILFTYEREMKDLSGIRALYMQREQDFLDVQKGGEFIYQNAAHLRSRDFKKKLKILVSDLILNANIK